MMYNVVKAELISNKSEWSMGSVATSESKCVKLTLENPDDWQDEGGVFIFFQEQSPRIFERWAKVFEDLGNNVIEGESIPERFRVMKNVVIDWYNLPEPCFKKYDKKIYHKGNLIHNVGDTIVDKTGRTKVYTKVKVVSYKVARGEDGELVWAFDPDVIIQKMIGRIYFPMSTLSSKPVTDSEDDVADEEEQQLTYNLILWKHIYSIVSNNLKIKIMKKFNFNQSALELVNYVESVQSTFWQAEQGNFPNTWGGVNALTKRVVKDILDSIELPYSKELGSYVRFIVEFEYTNKYLDYKRSIIGLTIEDVVFDQLIMFKSRAYLLCC